MKNPAKVVDTIYVFTSDTVYINNKDIVNQHYLGILEKTNEQLSLWFNPYGVLIGVLGILFTVLAAVAAIIIFKQSKENKDLVKTFLLETEQKLDVLIANSVNRLLAEKEGTNDEKKIESINEQIKELTTPLLKPKLESRTRELRRHMRQMDLLREGLEDYK